MLHYYQRIGRLRPDVVILNSGPVESAGGASGNWVFKKVDWYIYTYRQTQYGVGGEQGYPLLQALKTQTPVFEVSYEGVPLMKLYGGLK
jgi:hypothetical protein